VPRKKITAEKRGLTEKTLDGIVDELSRLLNRDIMVKGPVNHVAMKIKDMIENLEDSNVKLTESVVNFYNDNLADLDNLPSPKEKPKEIFPVSEIEKNLEIAANDKIAQLINEASKVQKKIKRGVDSLARKKDRKSLEELQTKHALKDFNVAAAMERKKQRAEERENEKKLGKKRLKRGRKKETTAEAFKRPSKATYAMMLTLAKPELSTGDIYKIIEKKIATIKMQEVKLVYYFTKKMINYLEFKGMLKKTVKDTGAELSKEEIPEPVEKLKRIG
jgi:hypothetical protein